MGNLSLFSDAETFSNKRPDKLPATALKAFWLKMANEVTDEGWSDDAEEFIAEDLADLYLGDSGFEMAKDLERGHATYTFSGDFITWLDDLSWQKDEALNQVVSQWVKAKNPLPAFKLQDKLIATDAIVREIAKGSIFYITGFKTETACYLVSTDKNRNGGYIIAYEVLEAKSELAPGNDETH